MTQFRMAWRNVLRGGRRSVVTICAMIFGLLMMICYSGLLQGYLAGLERTVVGMELGDVQIHTPGYADDPSLYEAIPAPETLVRRIEAAGLHASPRMLGGALAATERASAGALLHGLELKRDAQVSELYRQVARGRWLAEDDPQGVVVGRRLARALELAPDSELVLLSQATDGSVANDLFHVRGVLKSIGDATDRTGVYLTAASFRNFFSAPDEVHVIIVRRPAEMTLERATAIVRAVAPGLDVKNWRELSPTVASMLDSSQALLVYIFMIVYVAIAMLVLNAMLMAVFERVREYGVLKALGMGPLQVFGLIYLESGIQVLLATAAGLVLSLPALGYLARVGLDMSALGGFSAFGVAFDPIWRAQVTQATFAGPLLSLWAIVLVAVLYPAAKAAVLDPVQAIHHH